MTKVLDAGIVQEIERLRAENETLRTERDQIAKGVASLQMIVMDAEKRASAAEGAIESWRSGAEQAEAALASLRAQLEGQK